MDTKLPSHDELVELLRRDPDAYEALRHELIDELIAGAPENLKPRLRGLQFRIDGVRSLSHSSLGATTRLHEMMWESFLSLNHELKSFSDGSWCESPPPELISAQVLPFRSSQAHVGR